MTEMISGIRAFPRHLRQDRLCMKGGRGWFASRGLSWSDFVNEGVPVEVLEEAGDPLALRVAEAARAEADGSR